MKLKRFEEFIDKGQDAKWNDVENWFNGGLVLATEMQSDSSLPVDFDMDNNDPEGVSASIHSGGVQVNTYIDQFDYAKV